MGLFSVGVALDGAGGVSKDLLHRHECRVCPLNNEVLYNPKMLPTGSSKPLIYLIGEANGAEEDKEGKQFVGKAGQLLRQYIPKEWIKQIRWNNTIRCRPPKNRDPEEVEIEACRPSIVRDIEATKPQFIFAFGNVPLRWLLGQAGISNWRGRWAPVQIGQHKCWAFFFLHPSYISRKGGKESEEERVFGFDIQNALELIEKWTSGKSFESFKPVVHSAQDARANIECLTGHGPNDFRRVLDWLKYIQNEPEAICGVDYENYPLKPYNNGIILSCAVALRGRTLAWGWHHPQAGWLPEQLEVLDKAWLEFLLSPARKISHNAQHELIWSAHLWGREVLQNKTWEDTVTQAFVLDERSGVQQGGPLSLGFLVLQYFGINVKYLVNLDKKDLRNEPLEEVLLYNGSDAKYHEALYWKQHFRLRDEQLENQYQDMLRRVRTCALTQLKGIPLDLDENKKQDKELGRAIEEISAEIAASPEAKRFKSNFHKEFEPGSPKRVALLCSMLGFDSQSDKDGKDHTDENYLNSVDHPIAKSIVRYRKLVKLRSTYVTSVAEAAYQGVLHHNLNTVFVKTSRTSADGPNMQNWTKHAKLISD